jgi:hypothetical protein
VLVASFFARSAHRRVTSRVDEVFGCWIGRWGGIAKEGRGEEVRVAGTRFGVSVVDFLGRSAHRRVTSMMREALRVSDGWMGRVVE